MLLGCFNCIKKVKFLAEGLVDIDKQLQQLGSKLVMRVGEMQEVVNQIIKETAESDNGGEIKGIWFTKNFASEELEDEQRVRKVAQENNIDVKIWDDNFLIDLVSMV